MENKLLEFQNVTYSYEEEGPAALQGVSFSVEKGEFVVILGHNGSGKSTIAKLSNSIYLPNEGKVFVNGMDTAEDENEMNCRKTVGVVFQNPDNQIVASIVEEDVAFGPENLCIPQKELRVRVDEALHSVGMYDYRHHETHKLSGGQKQRVAIAGILAMKPQCIVLDEPTAMLDPKGRREVMKAVQKLNREEGITVLFITHFMEEAVDADRVMVVDDGKILLDGTPAEIFRQSDLLKKVGLDVPEVARLAAMLRENGVELGDVLTEEAFLQAFAKRTEG
ncbi:MAG: energy-coupling factor transporter ATPase [Ruminococcaceae bacterium]|nr:energy-coupling factor transporter ATPase [Oscillospiraceae bacterium]